MVARRRPQARDRSARGFRFFHRRSEIDFFPQGSLLRADEAADFELGVVDVFEITRGRDPQRLDARVQLSRFRLDVRGPGREDFEGGQRFEGSFFAGDDVVVGVGGHHPAVVDRFRRHVDFDACVVEDEVGAGRWTLGGGDRVRTGEAAFFLEALLVYVFEVGGGFLTLGIHFGVEGCPGVAEKRYFFTTDRFGLCPAGPGGDDRPGRRKGNVADDVAIADIYVSGARVKAGQAGRARFEDSVAEAAQHLAVWFVVGDDTVSIA